MENKREPRPIVVDGTTVSEEGDDEAERGRAHLSAHLCGRLGA